MGLDMYLNRKTYIGNNYKTVEDQIPINIPGVNQAKVSSVVELVGEWRKANAIHKWFVDNVQNGIDDCRECHVSQEKLEELLVLVDQVLADNSKADDLLPTTNGFFFGGTEYDEWYFNGLKETKKILEEALANKEEGDFEGFYYQSSW